MRWKSLERQIAEMLGGKRVPVTGRSGVEGQASPDIEHPLWSLEVKHRKDLPAWLRYATEQANKSRKNGHIAAVTILHAKGSRVDQSAVVMSLKDLIEIQQLLTNQGIPEPVKDAIGAVKAG